MSAIKLHPSLTIDPASYRDPAGYVLSKGDRIFRVVTNAGEDNFRAFYANPIIEALQKKGLLQPSRILSMEERLDVPINDDVAEILEHKVLPLISYPYEWPFEALRAAALFHLGLHQELLSAGLTLKDASAYNVQFDGALPLFIDTLSVRCYQEGEYWLAHNQFIRHFLNPLLLESYTGISAQLWLRSCLEGIDSTAIVKTLPMRAKLNYRLWLHLFLPVLLDSSVAPKANHLSRPSRPLPKNAMVVMLKQLEHLIANLRPPLRIQSSWSEYSNDNSYSPKTEESKRAAVHRFVETLQPSRLVDIGCNDGHYSRIALDAGAKRVFGLDSDVASLDRGFLESQRLGLKFTPLVIDLANPSPSQGWLNKERPSIFSRLNADCCIALAIVHHLAIGRNLPLVEVAKMFLNLAPQSLVEFVPREDQMVKLMLSQREDVFGNYNIDQFINAVKLAGGEIVSVQPLTESSRSLLHIRRINS